jgi:hypothetical protein
VLPITLPIIPTRHKKSLSVTIFTDKAYRYPPLSGQLHPNPIIMNDPGKAIFLKYAPL